jgi:DNA-binding CsgD family transcriptional regulator
VILGRPTGKAKRVKLTGRESQIQELLRQKIPKIKIAKKLKVSTATLYSFLHQMGY